jgi:hypothetical protein
MTLIAHIIPRLNDNAGIMAKPTSIGKCRLCGNTAELRRSHVLSEFMYKPLYDKNHRAVSVLANRQAPEEIIQKGYREYLLCQTCETRFSGWETPAAVVWRDALSRLRGASPGAIVVVPADYRTFKLFSLSLMWRTAVATHDNFAAADLGKLEPHLRQMLLASTPGAVTEFQSLAVAYANLDQLIGVIGPCGGAVWNGLNTLRLSISGIQWFFFAEPNAGSLLPHPAVTHQGFTVVVSSEDESNEIKRMARELPL